VLPQEPYSLAVRRRAAELAAQGSFDEATAALRTLTGEPIGNYSASNPKKSAAPRPPVSLGLALGCARSSAGGVALLDIRSAPFARPSDSQRELVVLETPGHRDLCGTPVRPGRVASSVASYV
jgi:hypothetical protein